MTELRKFNAAEPYLAVKNDLGEGPYWDQSTNIIRWVNVPKGEVHVINVAEGPSSHKILASPGMPIGLTVNIKGRKDAFLAIGKWCVGLIDNSTGKYSHLKASFTDEEKARGTEFDLRFNDGSVDPQGRLWVGTMVDTHLIEEWKHVGTLYRFDADLKTHRVVENASIPNGISWTADQKTMYWTDSMDFAIYQFDYDAATGNVSNRRPLIKFDPQVDGAPDGHAMDAEEHLWVAMFFGSKVLRVSPQGKVVAEIAVPTRCVTCPRFVGDSLFITTAAEMEPDKYPDSVKNGGNVFLVKVGIQGAPIYDVVLNHA